TPELPQTMYPDAIISRPWDFIPLVLFIAISTLLLPRFHRRYPSPFATALWLSTVPDIVTEFHMAFGSETLFDNSFHIAHFTKIVAYAVPMSGLLMDYALTHRKLSQSNQRAATLNAELTRHAAELGRTNEALARTNDDLERFAYAASHDLRAPLRAIDNLSQWLEEDIGEQLEGENREHFQLLRRRVKRMDELLNALLLYSRVGRIEHQVTEVDVRGMLLDIAEAHGLPAAAELELPDALPTLHTDRAALHQVFANLVSNAIKHHDRDRVHITISHERRGDDHHFTVQDDGPGIPPQFHQKVFEMFQTLRPRDELEASGMGLALVKKQVELSGGTLTLSCPGKRGTTFAFSWPDRWPDHHPTTTTPSHQSM
ncbi:MAG: ATP-binding protein, partial [Myxococcota bacterium]